MAKYIKATDCADVISEKLNIPLGDLVDVFAEIPAADVVPKSEVAREIFAGVEKIIRKHDERPKYNLIIDLAELKKKYTEGGAE